MKKKWSYSSNVFLVATRSSCKKMLGLASYHLSALEAEKEDNEIFNLLTATKPFVENYQKKYAQWKAAKATLCGELKRFTFCLKEMQQHLSDWDIAIQKYYRARTADYKKLFSKGKQGFYIGSYEERLSELDTLEKQLALYPLLEEVLEDVKTYNSKLKDLKNNKLQKAEQLRKASNELENSRIAVGKIMFRNLGLIMFKYSETPASITKFYDLELLRRRAGKHEDDENKSYILKVARNTCTEAGIAFGENEGLIIFNNSNTKIGVFAAVENPATPPVQLLTLDPDEEKHTSLAELNGHNCRFLFFVNNDMQEDAEIEIILV